VYGTLRAVLVGIEGIVNPDGGTWLCESKTHVAIEAIRVIDQSAKGTGDSDLGQVRNGHVDIEILKVTAGATGSLVSHNL
jgi:hypothetical protein